jgi:hypothetical protein
MELEVAQGSRDSLCCLEDPTTLISSFCAVTAVANPEDKVRIATSDDVIAMAVDSAFLELVDCKRPHVLLQTCPIKAVLIVHEMSIEGVNFSILLIFGSFRSCSSCLLTALSGRDNGVFGSRLSNVRFECGGLGQAH